MGCSQGASFAPDDQNWRSDMMKFGAAQSVRRVEDTRLLRGDGRYTDDITRPGVLYGAVLRSPHASARITSINADAARALPGVTAVYTGRDLVDDGIGHLPCAVDLVSRDGTSRKNTPRPALADGMVRYAGDPVAFVVAETHEAARDAAEAVEVEYEVLPSVTDLRAATGPGAPLVWPDQPGNVSFDWETGDKAQVDALFARAAHVTRVSIVNNRIVVASMEARVALAEYDEATGRWTLHTNTQGVWLLKAQLAEAIFKVEPERFRVVTNDVGGGFGMKIFLYPEHVLACYAARKLGRPVKWTSDRSEAFLSDTHGRDNLTEGEMAVDGAGKVLALRSRNVANMGAYLSTFGPAIPTVAGSKVLASVYDFKAIHLNVVGAFTNTVPVDAYRGAGRPESNYLVERLMDAAARELGQDPIAFRRANMVQPSAMPYRSAMGEVYDSGEFGKVLDAGLRQIDYAGFAARRSRAAGKGLLRGVGMAYYLEATMGAETERAEIRFAADGHVEVLVGTQSSGQGHETAYIQLTAAQLGRHGRRAEPVLRGPGHPGGCGQRRREGQAGCFGGAGSGNGRHQLRGRRLRRDRHGQAHRHPCAGRAAAHAGGRRRGGDLSGCRRGRERGNPHLPERLPPRGGGGGPGNRHHRGRALQRLRRHGPDDQPDDRPRPGAGRGRAGHRAGAVRAHGL